MHYPKKNGMMIYLHIYTRANQNFWDTLRDALWGFLDLKSELIRKGETQNQGKNGQI